jgi:hypothetical protein
MCSLAMTGDFMKITLLTKILKLLPIAVESQSLTKAHKGRINSQ